LFGFGAGTTNPSYVVSPWTVAKEIITRNNQAAEAIVLALALGVPLASVANSSVFTDGKNDAGSLVAVDGATDIRTLGFVSAETAEADPSGKSRVLPYQHYGQS